MSLSIAIAKVPYMTKHQVFHERSKHIDVKLHFERDILAGGCVEVQKISTDENLADVFIKVLPIAKFRLCLDLVHSKGI